MSDIDNSAPAADEPVATDNSPAQDVSEASTQTNEAPEATQAVKEPEVKAEDKAEDALIAGKFKTQEDLVKGYQELESRFGKEASEKAELTRILNEAFAADQPQQASQESNDNFQDEPDPLINQEISSLKTRLAINEFLGAHSDADPVALNDVLKGDPYVAQIASPEAKLEYAYLRSQNMTQPKAIAEAKKTAAQETQAKIVEKQTAQVESARKAEQTDEKSELLERITSKGSTQAESDAARREYIKRYLV